MEGVTQAELEVAYLLASDPTIWWQWERIEEEVSA